MSLEIWVAVSVVSITRIKKGDPHVLVWKVSKQNETITGVQKSAPPDVTCCCRDMCVFMCGAYRKFFFCISHNILWKWVGMLILLHPLYVNFRFLISLLKDNFHHSMRVTVERDPVAKVEPIFETQCFYVEEARTTRNLNKQPLALCYIIIK